MTTDELVKALMAAHGGALPVYVVLTEEGVAAKVVGVRWCGINGEPANELMLEYPPCKVAATHPSPAKTLSAAKSRIAVLEKHPQAQGVAAGTNAYSIVITGTGDKVSIIGSEHNASSAWLNAHERMTKEQPSSTPEGEAP